MRKIQLFLSLVIILTSFTSFSPDINKRKVKNIILLIGDGMGLSYTYAAYMNNNWQSNILSMPVTGLSKTTSANNRITDSAAGGTAISTGRKTNNGMIAIDSSGRTLETIIEIAEKNNMLTGVAVTCDITHATPASFIGHCVDRGRNEEIALDYLHSGVDVLIGGGLNSFTKRKDGLNLVDSLKVRGFVVYDSINQIKAGSKALCFTSKEFNKPIYKNGISKLPAATQKAIEVLNTSDNGFFLMIEGSQIDWGGHANNYDYIIGEMLDFDKAVGNALAFAKNDGNTLVIVTADHETGGLTLTGSTKVNKLPKAEFSTIDHTASPVIVYAYGPESQNFTGFYENTQVFYKMLDALGFQK